MTKFEKQLRQWFPAGEFLGTPVYTGKTMLSRLDDNLLVKVSFIHTKIAQHYDALRVKIMNRTEGEIDSQVFCFEDVIGKMRMRTLIEHKETCVGMAANMIGVRKRIADYERMKKLFCFGGNRAQLLAVFYDILSKLCVHNIPPELMGAVRLIGSDYCDSSLTNAMLAAKCNMSEVYFRKLFTKHFGISPRQYIIDARIEKAKQLLAEGTGSVCVISEACGFSNPYHFCRMFKQKTGTTPTEYRKANQVYEI